MCNNNAARSLSRCYLRAHLVKNTTRAQNKPSKKNKSHPRTLKSKLRAMPNQTRVSHEYNTKGLQHFNDLLTAELRIYADLSFHEFC